MLPVTFLANDAKPSGDTVNAKIRIETDLTGVERGGRERFGASRPCR